MIWFLIGILAGALVMVLAVSASRADRQEEQWKEENDDT